jgi:hypothetical protein
MLENTQQQRPNVSSLIHHTVELRNKSVSVIGGRQNVGLKTQEIKPSGATTLTQNTTG